MGLKLKELNIGSNDPFEPIMFYGLTIQRYNNGNVKIKGLTKEHSQKIQDDFDFCQEKKHKEYKERIY